MKITQEACDFVVKQDQPSTGFVVVEEAIRIVVVLAAGEVTEEELADWFRARLSEA